MNSKAAKTFLKILFFVSVLALFTTCSKRTESLITGTWIVENTGQEAFPEDAKWIFHDDGKLEVYKDINIPNSYAVFEWSAFSRTLVIPYIEILVDTDPDHIDPKLGLNGKWRVEKIIGSKLIINRVEFLNGDTGGAFLRREFIRE